MGKKLLLMGCFILLGLLVSEPTSMAANTVFLDYISLDVPKNNVLLFKPINTNKPTHVNSPSMDIQHVYLSLDGLNLTMKMKMGASAVINVTITCSIQANFYYNSTFNVNIMAFKGSGNYSYNTINLYKYQSKLSATQLYGVTNHPPIQTSGRYIFWIIDLTGLNKFIPINKLFIKYTIFREIQTKYEIYPNMTGYIFNVHGPKTGGIADYMIYDNFSLRQTKAPTISNYFWPILITSGVLVIVIAALVINRKRIRKFWQDWKNKGLSKNTELYPEEK